MTTVNPGLAFADLERVYEALAGAIDKVGPGRESVMLAKLTLVLAHRLGDRAVVEQCIEMALQDLLEGEGRQS